MHRAQPQSSCAPATGEPKGSFPPHSAKEPEPGGASEALHDRPHSPYSPAPASKAPKHTATSGPLHLPRTLFFLTRNDSSWLSLSSPSPLDCFHRTYHTQPGILYSLEHRFTFYPCPFVRAGTLSAPFWARRAPSTEWQLSKRLRGGPDSQLGALPVLPSRTASRPPGRGRGRRHTSFSGSVGTPQLLPEKSLTVSLARSLCARERTLTTTPEEFISYSCR